MSNLVELFPDTTDEEYEDRILPILIRVLAQLHEAVDNGQFDVIEPAAKSLLNYCWRSMLYLDESRKLGVFKNNQFPKCLSSAIDNLAADAALALGGDGVEDLARNLRDRSPTKRSSFIRLHGLWNDPTLPIKKLTIMEWVRKWHSIDIAIGWQSKGNYANWKMWIFSVLHGQNLSARDEGKCGVYMITLLGFYFQVYLFTLGKERKWVKTK